MLSLGFGLRARLGQYFCRAKITEPTGAIPLIQGPITFVEVVGYTFDQTKPDAYTKCSLGFCRGAEQLGIPYLLLDVRDLSKRLPDLVNPVCRLSSENYKTLSHNNARALKRVPHAVWVNPWFDKEEEFYEIHDLPNLPSSNQLRYQILSTRPAFVFTVATAVGMDLYEGWRSTGTRVVSIPLACDTALYRPEGPHYPEFDEMKIVFVGGYWPEKARQFDKYLRPYEDNLTVYGYNRWPYKGYKGQLPFEAEPALYRQAMVCPCINESRCELMGDVNERVFKVLGSGGLCIPDSVSAYRDLFTEDELLVPKSVEEFHQLMSYVMNNPSVGAHWRNTGIKAVLAKHAYLHRVRTFLEELGMDNYLPELGETG